MVRHRVTTNCARRFTSWLLALSFIISTGVGVFEVGLALRDH
jgi:hypothetical protein